MGAATEISEHPEAEPLLSLNPPFPLPSFPPGGKREIEGEIEKRRERRREAALESKVCCRGSTPHPAPNPLSRHDPHPRCLKSRTNSFFVLLLLFYRPSDGPKVKVKEKSGLENHKA
jgi:hypothetical protein